MNLHLEGLSEVELDHTVVYVRAWRDGTVAGVPGPTYGGARRTFVSELLHPTRHDSITVHIVTPKCSRGDGFSFRLMPSQLQSGTPISVSIIPTRRRAVLAVGERACGVGYRGAEDPTGFAVPFDLHLRFDQVRDSIVGRWILGWQESRGAHVGRFVGTRVEGTLILLADADPGRPWGCDPRYRIVISVNANEALGITRIEGRGGCPAPAPTLDLVFDDSPDIVFD